MPHYGKYKLLLHQTYSTVWSHMRSYKVDTTTNGAQREMVAMMSRCHFAYVIRNEMIHNAILIADLTPDMVEPFDVLG